jgi:Na+/glutamate symporter
MWGSLLRIEGTTARTDATVTMLASDVRDIKHTQEQQQQQIDENSDEITRINAERAQQVPVFEALIKRVDVVEKTIIEETTKAKTAGRMIGFVWAIFGGVIVSFLTFLMNQYMHAEPPQQPPQHQNGPTSVTKVEVGTGGEH